MLQLQGACARGRWVVGCGLCVVCVGFCVWSVCVRVLCFVLFRSLFLSCFWFCFGFVFVSFFVVCVLVLFFWGFVLFCFCVGLRGLFFFCCCCCLFCCVFCFVFGSVFLSLSFFVLGFCFVLFCCLVFVLFLCLFVVVRVWVCVVCVRVCECDGLLMKDAALNHAAPDVAEDEAKEAVEEAGETSLV